MIYFLTVNYYATDLIARLISSLSPNQEGDYQLLIVNNSPGEKTLEKLQNNNITILNANTNLGFANACNLGLDWIYQRDEQAVVWLINPDAYLREDLLLKAVEIFDHYPEVSILGTLIYTPTGELWFGGGCFIPQLGAIFPKKILKLESQKNYIPCDWVSGCSLLINLKQFSSCPQFNSAYFLYYEDFDFCQQYAKQGHLVAITHQLAVIHEASVITNRNPYHKIRYSTYSYLLTLRKYTHPFIFWIRLLRLGFNACLLFPVNPEVSFGKFVGIADYFNRATKPCQITF